MLIVIAFLILLLGISFALQIYFGMKKEKKKQSLKKFEDLTIDIEKVKKEFPYTEYWVWEDEEEDVDLGEVGNGNIELMDLGDGQTWNIIVTGKERGQMWIFSDVGIEPCAPKRDFLSWYESWLDGNDDYFAGFED